MQKHVPENYCGGSANWRLSILHGVAKALGLLVHVEGFPLGSRRNIINQPGDQKP